MMQWTQLQMEMQNNVFPQALHLASDVLSGKVSSRKRLRCGPLAVLYAVMAHTARCYR